MKRKSPDDKPQGIGTKILKGIGIATAIISLILGGNQVYKMILERQHRAERDKKIGALLKDSESQVNANDYNGAWKTLKQAQELNADSREVEKEQVQVAMKWIRSVYFERTAAIKNYSEVVDMLTPVLNHELNLVDDKQAADILAHIGWANYLKSFDGITDLKTEELFQEAIRKDSLNVYANAMWGYWLIKNGNPLDEAKAHFEMALKGDRDKPFVRQMQLYAFYMNQDINVQMEIMKVVNSMRKGAEELSVDKRQGIVNEAYNFFGKELFDSINTVLSPDEHLATFNYLISQTDYATHPNLLLTHALLLENAGEKSKALVIFQSLKKEKYFARMKEVDDGIKRITGKK
ncbi:MAG TPA: hypothetical protein VE978_25575 [Chitinophagales bacterium]|nr:hypothetical protein [Chitinophagales bacterium]